MKGMVFTEFLEMVEETFSEEMADAIIEGAHLPSGGAYTTVGTYDHLEMMALVDALHHQTGIPAAELVQNFGRYLFQRFFSLYPQMFEGIGSTTDFLMRIENYIHVEVRKLYADAQLPVFQFKQETNRFELIYRSDRPFADLAEGLIHGCIQHYGEPWILSRLDLDPPGCAAHFVLVRE